MSSNTLIRRLFLAVEALLLAGAIAAAVWRGHAYEWHPFGLVALLLVLALTGQWLHVTIRSGHLTAAHIALVLAMALLGPAPAVAFGIAAMVFTSGIRRLPASQWLNNLCTHSVYPLIGGLMVVALVGNVHDPHNHQLAQSATFGLVVFVVFMVTLALNFTLVALDVQLEGGPALARQTREAFVPLLPGHLASAALAALLAVAYTRLGLSALVAAIVVLLIFQSLTNALLRSEDRAEKLEARTIQLASLQVGVLATLMDALALRDHWTARHATAVARYAKALAVELGCNEAEQEVIHSAALLHDIGKFTWSDRVLHPESLTDGDWEVIRRHPQDGATLVGKLDGYGPVADAILYHHERVDGGGYPAGLIGNEIPFASRIIAICSTYDTMTARATLGAPISPPDAMAELRAIAGKQLDRDLVERFIAMLEREGATFAQDTDFETELGFERRVRKMAQPSTS